MDRQITDQEGSKNASIIKNNIVARRYGRTNGAKIILDSIGINIINNIIFTSLSIPNYNRTGLNLKNNYQNNIFITDRNPVFDSTSGNDKANYSYNICIHKNAINWKDNNIDALNSYWLKDDTVYSLFYDNYSISNWKKETFQSIKEKCFGHILEHITDKGNPDPQYNDRDGSRNDLGPEGGPWYNPDAATTTLPIVLSSEVTPSRINKGQDTKVKISFRGTTTVSQYVASVHLNHHVTS